VPLDFPSSILEPSDAEVKDYITPADFAIGKEVNVLGRVFLVYDMDEFSRTFYRRNFNVTDFTPLDVAEPDVAAVQPEIPPYNGIGSPEDSYLSCIMIDPKAPAGKKSLLQLLKHDNKVLRYEATLDPEHHQNEEGRTFILSLRLADNEVSVFEPPVQNSGIQGGTILAYQQVARPGCNPDKPEYVGPSDFYVGGQMEIFKKFFNITGCDRAVLNFMEENPQYYTAKAMADTKALFP
jgi:hypothetical protein